MQYTIGLTIKSSIQVVDNKMMNNSPVFVNFSFVLGEKRPYSISQCILHKYVPCFICLEDRYLLKDSPYFSWYDIYDFSIRD